MISFDKDTELWFRKHIGEQTTLCKCDVCGLFYKPELGHKCPKEQEDDKTGSHKQTKSD